MNWLIVMQHGCKDSVERCIDESEYCLMFVFS